MNIEKSSGKYRLTVTIIVAVLAILAAMAISVWYFAAENQPVKTVLKKSDPAEYFALATLSGKAMDILSKAKKNPAKDFTLSISPAELNTVIAIVLRKNKTKLQDTSIQWQHGKLAAANTVYKLGGSYFNLRLEIVPRFANGIISTTVHSAKLGSLPLPAASLEKTISDEVTRQLTNNPEWHKKLNLIKLIQADDRGNLEITLTGENLLKLVRSFSL